jgi:hypothetical protein
MPYGRHYYRVPALHINGAEAVTLDVTVAPAA